MDEQLEAERRSMAQALQESVINQLQLLIAQANIYDQTLKTPEARMAISVLMSLARQALQQAFDLESSLNPVILELGLEPALENLTAQMLRTHGLRVSIEIDRMPIPEPVELALYRLIQEALNHAVRQASAHHIRIQIRHYQDDLICRISHDGTSQEFKPPSRRMIEQLGGTLHIDQDITARFQIIMQSDITEREMDVLRCLVAGMTNKEIAATLKISPRTVKFHLDNLYSKLGVNTRTEAAVIAINQGLTK